MARRILTSVPYPAAHVRPAAPYPWQPRRLEGSVTVTLAVRPVLVLILLAAACSPGSAATTFDVVAALCEAREAGSVADTRDIFYSRAHDHLHDLADDLLEADRAATGRLLVVKNQVEAALDEGLPEPMVDDRLAELITETRLASQQLGRPASDC